MLPSDGIRVYSGLLHSHLLGNQVIVQHIRNKIELEPILSGNTSKAQIKCNYL